MANSNLTTGSDRYFRITGFYPAAFLFSKGMELVNIDKTTNPKRARFVFRNPERCEELLHLFDFAQEDSQETVVDARKLVSAIKTLKEKLYQNKF